MKSPLVYVLVINWNGREHLEECFDSLVAGVYPNARFVLIDNGSTDGSAEFVKQRYGHDARVEVIRNGSNLGWSGGNNVGMERALDAGADYVFLLNNDTVTAPDTVAKLVEMAEPGPEIGALAPKMLLYDNPAIVNSLGLECSVVGCGWDIGIGQPDGPEWNEPRQVIGVCGGACFLRSEALRKTGLLPTDFDIYLDDLDLCLRIWNAGYEIWNCPQAVVRHKFGATMGKGKQVRRKYYLNTRNRARLVARNFPWSKWAYLKLMYLWGEGRAIGRAILDGEFWRVWVHLKAWAAYIPYAPKVFAEKAWRRRTGLNKCRFWHLVRKQPLFFPGVDLPGKAGKKE